MYFADSPKHILKAYADSGEGLDRAGGFAIQVNYLTACFTLLCTNATSVKGLGGLLVRKVEGDYHNIVGFPAASFFKLLDLLIEEEPDFLDV